MFLYPTDWSLEYEWEWQLLLTPGLSYSREFSKTLELDSFEYEQNQQIIDKGSRNDLGESVSMYRAYGNPSCDELSAYFPLGLQDDQVK